MSWLTSPDGAGGDRADPVAAGRGPRGGSASRLWGLADAALDLLLGGRCAGCGRPGRALCSRCRALALTPENRWHEPHPLPDGFPATLVTGAYLPPWPALLSAYKERGQWALAPVLAQRLWPALVALVLATGTDGPVVLVPMPSRRAAVRQRGLDTTARLAGELARVARRHGWALTVRPALRFTRRVADSAGLGSVERAENLAGALRLPAGLAARWRREGRQVILCDDLVTTGASLTEAARAVEDAGVGVVGAVAVVATVRRGRRARSVRASVTEPRSGAGRAGGPH